MTSDITAWLTAAGRVPLLRADEEIHLGGLVRQLYDWPGGPEAAPANLRRAGLRARDRMIQANLRLVVSVAQKFQARARANGLDIADLLQEGVLGLARGVEKFDPARGFKFSTFGFWWIRQAMGRYLDVNCSGSIRLPVAQAQLPWQVQQTKQRLALELDREPKPSEVAEAMGTTAVDLAARLERVRRAHCISLDSRIDGGDDRGSLADLVADPNAVDPMVALDRQLALSALEDAMAELPEPERQALDLLTTGVPRKEAAAAAGCSLAALRDRQARAKGRLRRQLERLPAQASPMVEPGTAAAVAEPAGELLAEPVQLELAMASPEPEPPAAAAPAPAVARATPMRERMAKAWSSNRRRQLVAA